MLFTGLVSETPTDEIKDFLSEIESYTTNFFSETQYFTPNFIGAFFDIYLSYKNYIRIDPKVLVDVAKNSGLLSTASLLLEEYILSEDDSESTTKKNSGDRSGIDRYWMCLAEIYKEMNEWDGVNGIFSKKIDFSNELLVKAVTDEAAGLWQRASDTYKSLIETDASANRRDFYYESYFKCYAHLSNWESVTKYITDEIKLDNVWDSDWNQENILPWFFSAGVYTTLVSGKNTELLQCLNNWMTDSDKSEYIKNKFSEELSVLSLAQNDWKACKYYMENYIRNFLTDWSSLSALFFKTRTKKITELQKVMVVNDLLDFHENLQVSNCVGKARRFLNGSKRLNDGNNYCYSTALIFVTTELKMIYRKFVIDKVKELASTFSDEEELDILSKDLDELRLETIFNFISFSINQKNSDVANKYITRLNNLTNAKVEPGVGEYGIRMSVLKCEIILEKTEREEDPEKKLLNLLKWWEHLGKCLKFK